MPTRLTLVSVAALSCAAYGQQTSQPNRITAAAWLPFNISARFDGSGALAAHSAPGSPTGTAVNREYDDGYVRVDSEGNAGGVTWYWGYRNATQVPGNDTLLLHSASAMPDGSSTADADNPSLGFEVAYLRDFSRSDRFAWGLRSSLGYADIGITDSRPVHSPAHLLTDVYPLNGITPPGDPTLPGWQYEGARDLPGPVINSAPQERRTDTLVDAAVTTGSRQLDTGVFAWKLGPWLEFSLAACRT